MPAGPRRSCLQLLGTAVASGLAGCLGGRPRGGPPRTSGRNTDDATPTADDEARQTASDEARPEPVRCRGAPVSVERSVTDEPGYDDGIEYFPENGTVRFVSHVSGGEPAGFDTWSFEEWGRIRSVDVGHEPVQRVAGDRLGTTDGLGSSVGRPPPSTSAYSPAIWLRLTTSLDRDGEVRSTPTASLSELAAVAPGSADVTPALDGDEYARTVPIFAKAVTFRPARPAGSPGRRWARLAGWLRRHIPHPRVVASARRTVDTGANRLRFGTTNPRSPKNTG